MLSLIFMCGFMMLLVIAELPVSTNVQSVLLVVWALSTFVALIHLLRTDRQHTSIPVRTEQVAFPAQVWGLEPTIDEFYDSDRLALEQDGFKWDNEDTPGVYRVI